MIISIVRTRVPEGVLCHHGMEMIAKMEEMK